MSGTLLKEKVLHLLPHSTQILKNRCWLVNSGWLHRFVQWHSIRVVSLKGETLSVDTSEVDTFCVWVAGHSTDRELFS